jgi:formate hydrogenlyase transcriptional activator
MTALWEYNWPGNVRELENFIERSVILSRSSDFWVPLTELKPMAAGANGSTTRDAAERQNIVRMLQESKWVIGGPDGAAARLGMKRTTLHSLVKRLGITRPSQIEISTPADSPSRIPGHHPNKLIPG